MVKRNRTLLGWLSRTLLLGVAALFILAVFPGRNEAEDLSQRSNRLAVHDSASDVENRVASVLATMSIEEKCASLLFVAFSGGRRFTQEFAAQYRRIPVGGVLLFAYNIPRTAEELVHLTDGIRSVGLDRGILPFIAIDHEGGTVLRLRGLATEIPDARVIGRSKDKVDKVQRLYQLAGQQLSLLGFSMNLAPVIEPLSVETDPFLGRRAYSADPKQVAFWGEMFIEAMHGAGVIAVGKHFPATGNADPHERLPESSARPSNPDDILTLPFRILHQRGILDALMLAHVRLPNEGVQEPVTLSERILTEVLREKWGYEGLVLTDDFLMRGLTEVSDPIEGVIRSVQAGADMVMYLGKDFPRVHTALVQAVQDGKISQQRLDEAVSRVLKLKLRFGLLKPFPELLNTAKRVEEFDRLKQEGDALLGKVLPR